MAMKLKMYMTLTALVVCCVASDGVSKTRTVDGVLNTTEEQTRFLRVRYGHYVEFDCCSDNEVNITWFKFSQGMKQWEAYRPNTYDSELFENSQILAIKDASTDDEGLYKCVSKDRQGHRTEEIRFQLDVVSCDKLARGPFPVAPLSCSDTAAKENVQLMLPCTGYFGCADDGDESLNIVTWFVKGDGDTEWKEAKTFDPRYIQRDYKTNGGSVKGSNLTIEHVKNEDFRRKFMCLLSSPQEIEGQTMLFVELRKDGTDGLLQEHYEATISPDVIVVLLAVVLALVTCILVMMFVRQCQRERLSQMEVTYKKGSLLLDPNKPDKDPV